MKSIDYLNKYNPLALFGITESTDRTADEISQRKMSKKWADYRCAAFLSYVLTGIAAVRKEPAQQIAAATSANAKRFFKLPDPD